MNRGRIEEWFEALRKPFGVRRIGLNDYFIAPLRGENYLAASHLGARLSDKKNEQKTKPNLARKSDAD